MITDVLLSMWLLQLVSGTAEYNDNIVTEQKIISFYCMHYFPCQRTGKNQKAIHHVHLSCNKKPAWNGNEASRQSLAKLDFKLISLRSANSRRQVMQLFTYDLDFVRGLIASFDPGIYAVLFHAVQKLSISRTDKLTIFHVHSLRALHGMIRNCFNGKVRRKHQLSSFLAP